MGRDWKSCESGKIGHSKPLQWENIGKVANWEKLAVPNHSEPLQWKRNQNVTLTQNPTVSFLQREGGGGTWSYNLR